MNFNVLAIFNQKTTTFSNVKQEATYRHVEKRSVIPLANFFLESRTSTIHVECHPTWTHIYTRVCIYHGVTGLPGEYLDGVWLHLEIVYLCVCCVCTCVCVGVCVTGIRGQGWVINPLCVLPGEYLQGTRPPKMCYWQLR